MELKTLEQLKSHAYDCIANKEQWEKELKETNFRIANFKETPEVPKVEEKKEEVK